MTYGSLPFRFSSFGRFAVCSLILLLFSNSASAQGVTRSWTGGGATDNWFDAANWSPVGTPSDADILLLSTGDNAGLNANDVAISNGGRIEVSGSADLTLSALDVGDLGQGSLMIDAGNVSSSSGTIGKNIASVGRVAVDFGGTWAVGLDLDLGFAGNGVLDIRGGSQVTVAGDASLGFDVSGDGRVYVHGAGSLWDVEGVLIVADTGSATVEITGGGTMRSAGALMVTHFAGSATVLVDGVGSIWENTGALTLGEEAQATMIVSAGAVVENTWAKLGVFQTSNADATVTGAGSRWTNTGAVRIGDDGDAVLNVLGGASFSSAAADIAYQFDSVSTATVDGAGTTWTSSGSLISGRSGVGQLHVTGGAVVSSLSGVVSLSGTSAGSVAEVNGAGSRWETTSGSIQVGSGNGSNGTLNIADGGTVATASGITIGNGTGSTGTVTVSGTGSLASLTGNLLVGNVGTGTMTINSGGAATVSGVTDIGPLGTLTLDGGSLTTTSFNNSGGTFTFNSGTVTVDGGAFNPGGNFALNGSSTATMNLRGSGVSAFSLLTVGESGDAVFNLTEGHQLTLDEANIGASGEFVLDGGTLFVETVLISSQGKFSFLGGTLNLNGDVFESSSPVTLPSSGTLSGGGAVEAAINGLPGSTINVTSAFFSLGTPASFAGFVHEGTLNVGSNIASLHSAGYAQLGGLTTLASGGTINATNGIALGTGDVLEGSGTVNGKVAAAIGSIIQESNGGTLTLGEANAFDGFVSAGTLITQGGTIELLDKNQATLGTLTSLIGDASLVAANGLVVNFGSAIIGFGEVDTPNDPTKALINNGAIAGDSPADTITLAGYVKGVGTLDNVLITGTDAPGFSPAAVNRGSVSYNGTLEIELGGLNAGREFDQLNHILGSGIADLGGTLDVQFINGFTPSAGDTFEIITAASVINTFDTINLPALPGELLWFVNYEATSVELVSTYGADFDEDGDIDNDDLAAWEGGFVNAPAVHMTGDANADALASGFDFLTWQRQLGVGGGAALTAATIPATARRPWPAYAVCTAEACVALG